MAVGPERLLGHPFFVHVHISHPAWQDLYDKKILVQEYVQLKQPSWVTVRAKYHVLRCEHNDQFLKEVHHYRNSSYVILADICERITNDNKETLYSLKKEDASYI